MAFVLGAAVLLPLAAAAAVALLGPGPHASWGWARRC